jgi:hypothetical protein
VTLKLVTSIQAVNISARIDAQRVWVKAMQFLKFEEFPALTKNLISV